MFSGRREQARVWGAAGLLILDQFLKYFVSQNLALEKGGLFGYYLNRSFAWSLPLSNNWAIILGLGFLLVIVSVYLFSGRRPSLLLPIIWLGSGALSNLIDRIGRGGVVDYLFLPGGAAVNLADMMILIGMIWLLFIRRPPTTNLFHE